MLNIQKKSIYLSIKHPMMQIYKMMILPKMIRHNYHIGSELTGNIDFKISSL